MRERGENPHSLSLKSKVPQPTIFRILKGTSAEPRRGNLEKIAKALGVKIDVFYENGTQFRTSDTRAEQIIATYQAKKQLSADEETIICAYRVATDEGRSMLLSQAETILKNKKAFDKRTGA